jgi:hypothetical protein
MNCTFCFLEKDQKTFDYVKKYYSLIKAGDSTIQLDSCIQKSEIERNLELKSCDIEDQKAITDWINENSSGFRAYINSIKMLALFIYFIERSAVSKKQEELTYQLFTKTVILWNERKLQIADSIFI